MNTLRTFMRFPNGATKALTLSYDDGVEQDIKMIEILNKYGVKATFNINSGCYTEEGTVFKPGTIHRRMTHARALELYKDSGHEVAVHTYSHPWLEQLPPAMAAQEVIEDRINLEADYGKLIRGMAYPYGTLNDTVVEILKNSGIVYSRTTVSTGKFDIPTDWLRLPATCHHNAPNLMELAEKFVNMKVHDHPKLFYLWGHTYEFEANNNWNVIEEFCEYISGKEDIWYATNIDIYDYIDAYNRLMWSADGSMVYNPTLVTLWFKFSRRGGSSSVIKIEPGETLTL
ncbi:MAG: polysaccharide deacetylase family protein [Clostridia bacterium]|nr:polysaccharide deacetylase family protein [Clostridia bacterium]